MKDPKQMSEKDAIASIKGLAKGVFFVSILQFVAGIFFMNLERIESGPLLGGILIGIGATLFVLGWFLFKKQSYPVALALAIITGINLALNVFGAIGGLVADGGIESLSGATMSVLFFWVSYKGMKAAAVLKKIREEKISPDVFS